jgi:hypothetical protein
MNETVLVREEAPQNYLLVEGDDDAQVLHHLLKRNTIHEQVTIKKKGGIQELMVFLRTELKGSGERRLGIIIDADTDIAVRWQALRDRLVAFGYHTVPQVPLSDGTILVEDGQPVVGVWIMPNNKLPGMLEDFVSFLVPQGDPLWPMAEDVVQRVIGVERRFPPTQTIKAHLHTWLAWQEEPGKPMGQAITKRYLKAEAPHAQQLMTWIRQLFNLE